MFLELRHFQVKITGDEQSGRESREGERGYLKFEKKNIIIDLTYNLGFSFTTVNASSICHEGSIDNNYLPFRNGGAGCID